MKLDDTFLTQADIAKDLRDSLDQLMHDYGYTIVKVLSPTSCRTKVKAAMNDITAAAREREATVSRAGNQQLLAVKQARRRSASKTHAGRRHRNQSKEIIAGLKIPLRIFRRQLRRATPPDVMQLVDGHSIFDHAEGYCG